MILNYLLLLAMSGAASPGVQPMQPSYQNQTSARSGQILIAKGKKKKSKRGGRKRYLQGEARSSSTSTSIDFEAASIDGERRAPAGVQVGSTKQDQGYDLINLRLRWHPEMIKSTSNLETGKGQ